MGGKAEKGTPKYIANKIKAKGLQKLRWYCQMCQKQCRDENGFKCHTMSESHQRQLLLFADNAHELLDEFSKEFADGYCDLLQRQFGSKRVSANKVYQDYIADREHLHMNATQWETLTDFVKWAGREGRCTVDETEKGWFVTYIDRDPETVARQEAQAKKGKMDKDDAERMMEFIEKQVERGMQAGSSSSVPEYTELTRKDEDEKITVKLVAKPAAPKFLPPAAPLDKRKAFDSQSTSGSSISSTSSSAKKFKDGRKPSALDQIRFEEERRKQKYVKKPPPEPVRPLDAWLYEGIVVKVITDTLGPKYHKRKGTVLRVFSDYGAEVKMIDSGDKLKLDQEHLETVIPGLGRNVMAVLGSYRGQVGPLLQLEGEACRVQLGDRRVLLQFHELSKVGSTDS